MTRTPPELHGCTQPAHMLCIRWNGEPKNGSDVLGFVKKHFKKRLWEGHVKLATQNFLACEYFIEFEITATSAGLQPFSPLLAALEDALELVREHLSDLRLGEPSPSRVVSNALKFNRDLRREYDAVLQGRHAFEVRFGNASKRLLPFDEMFTPSEGWALFLDQFQSSPGPAQINEGYTQAEGNSAPEFESPKAWKSLGLGSAGSPSPESNCDLDDLVARGQIAGVDAEKLRAACEKIEPERLRKLTAMAVDSAREDREQNVRVALKQMKSRHTGSNPPQMRFFLADRSIPALEPEPGSMLLLGSDGSWGEIVALEVLADEGSPEVSEETFVSVVARLGGSTAGMSLSNGLRHRVGRPQSL